jgi:hypothetical protein
MSYCKGRACSVKRSLTTILRGAAPVLHINYVPVSRWSEHAAIMASAIFAGDRQNFPGKLSR